MSACASLLRCMRWCNLFAFMLSVIRRLMKSLPAGTPHAGNASLPISESSFRFVVLLRDCLLVSSSKISLTFSSGKRICWETESNSRGGRPCTIFHFSWEPPLSPRLLIGLEENGPKIQLAKHSFLSSSSITCVCVPMPILGCELRPGHVGRRNQV